MRISILIPCRNEADVINDTIQAILDTTRDLDKEVVVIDDSSTDNSFEISSKFISEGVKLFRKEHGGNGKWNALNYGIERCTASTVVIFDSDSRPEKGAIEKLLTHLGGDVVGACGMVKVRNKDENWLTRLISLEFSIANYLQWKKAFSKYYSPLFTGTLMAINKRYAVFSKSLVEDALLSMRLIRDGKEIAIEPSATATQIEPTSLRIYLNQRVRWARGNWDLLKFWGKGKKFTNTLFILLERIQPVFAIGSWSVLFASLTQGFGFYGMISWPTIILTTLFTFSLSVLGALIYKAIKFSGERYSLSTIVIYLTVYQFLFLAIWVRSLFPVKIWYKTPHNNIQMKPF